MGNIPYIIESNVLSQQGQEEAWNQGIYQVGSDLWAFIIIADQVTLDTRIGAYKSTDGLVGHSWAEQSTGPDCASIGGGGGTNYVFDSVAGKIYVAYFQPISFALSLAVFTLTGTSWAVTSIAGPVPAFPSNFSPNPLLQRTSGGDSFVSYWDGTDTHVIKYSGGWGSPHVLGSGEKLLSAIIDASDILWIFTFKGGGGANVVVRTFDGTTLSGSIGVTSGSASSRMGPGVYDSGADELIFPWLVGGTPGQDLILIRGTPSSSPVWTLDTAGNAGIDDTFYFPKYFKILGDDYAMCEVQSETGSEHMQLAYFQKTSGVWGSRVVFWDELTDIAVPPAVAFDTPTLWSGRLLSDGSTLGVTLGLLPAGFNVLCAEQYAMLVPFITPPPAISIACPMAPLTATVGVPYVSDAPIVTGGTGPYTFALFSGPGWMGIDTSTGVVSGTPDASGSITYEIEVTDSSSPPLSATVPAPCPLTVGPATPGTLPCDNITPQPATDVQFKLIKVLATMGPVKRLPTRGSVQ